MKNLLLVGSVVAASLSLMACDNTESDSDMDSVMNEPVIEYSITVKNLSQAQVIAPAAAFLHDDTFKAWSIGEVASVELEQMAEGGDASALLALASSSSEYLDTAVLLPGSATQFSISTDDSMLTQLTLFGMLVNTNDAFSGVSSLDLSAMAENDYKIVYAYTLDAGTEANTELVNTIPGQGGEGFNLQRDDITSVVTHHGGVVTQQDDYTDSILNEAHRFNNPLLKIEIQRLF